MRFSTINALASNMFNVMLKAVLALAPVSQTERLFET